VGNGRAARLNGSVDVAKESRFLELKVEVQLIRRSIIQGRALEHTQKSSDDTRIELAPCL